MTFARCTRGLYQLLLLLHPPAFRERFGKEMLWIFDQSVTDGGGTVRVIGDGFVSLTTQWMATDTVPRANTGSFQVVSTGSFSAAHLTQATAIALLVTLGFFKLLTQSVPLPQPAKDFNVWRGRFAMCAGHRCNSVPTTEFCGRK
jgi:hypothetical protein